MLKRIVAALALSLLATGLVAAHAADGLSESDQQCLACHAAQGLEKKLANGDTLSLHVQAEAFAKSVHKAIGCAGCHSNVDLKSHPGDVKNTAASAREHSVARVALCRLPDSTYTLLGSEVNTTFRMEPLTRQLGQPLIVSEAFVSGFTPNHVSFVPCGSHHLKGLPGPVSVLAATPSRPA